nr:EB module domain-containing protein [Crepidula fornicata]
MNCLVAAVLLCLAVSVHSQAVGNDCGGDGQTACGDGLVCQDSKCKAKAGENCDANSANCIAGAACATASGPCACDATKVETSDKMCGAKADAECTTVDATTTECLDGATCKMDGSTKKCKCNAMSMANTAMTKCLMYITQDCSAAADCVDNADCTSDKKCACKDKYMVNDDNSACKLKIGEVCNVGDCGVNSECKDDAGTKKCACKADFVDENGRCGMAAEGSCSINSDCVTNAECTGTGNDKKCSCKADYTADDNKMCKSGAGAMFSSMVLLLAAFVTSRLM